MRSFPAFKGEMAELIRTYNWSETPLHTPDQWPVSLRTLVNMLLASRFPMLLFWGPELITFYNDAFRPSLGDQGKHPSSLGQRGEESWAESWPVIGPMIYRIMAGGEAVWFEDQKLPLYRDGRMDFAYWTYSFSPVINEAGTVNGVLVTCSETTAAVLSRQALLESQQQTMALFEESPVGIAIVDTEGLVFRMANAFYGELAGRHPDQLIGRSLLEALPELQGQGFDLLLNQVITSRKPYIAYEVAAEVMRQGRLETIYVDLTYQPQIGTDGQVSGILMVCSDVSKQVFARQKTEESEARFRSLIEEAPVATCLFVGRELRIEVANKRILDIWGKGEAVLGKPLAEALPELLNQPFLEILDEIYTTGVPYNATADKCDLVINGELKTFYFNFTYEPLRNTKGEIYGIMDMAVDVTEQVIARQQIEESERQYRTLSTQLEELVQQRTEEIAAINEELSASNEELLASYDEVTTTNDQLNEFNTLLTRSNENLQQFAYVASHDLQEPLRKIQAFGQLLEEQYAESLGEGTDYLQRMQAAASRMSTLIQDLLTFSRISTRQDTNTLVSLTEVITLVRTDLDIMIRETGARMEIEPLPTLVGDMTQLGQLFQNLLSNALKFRKEGVPPVVQIRSELIQAGKLPSEVKPARQARLYYRIDVSDNGIGFEQKYTDRIFQVFQRLHGKSHYVGTGIGLAICEKVAVNHGGAITALGQPGQGATFSVYLPA
ncbi:PAS domain-containing sensor histidine kinase [Fibrella aquatica]|uniref:PAS domain-containing sensor histidine kinase n=1 Tax=Fibrella aquatica TaxID=3242487 RepID=UPI0035996FC8